MRYLRIFILGIVAFSLSSLASANTEEVEPDLSRIGALNRATSYVFQFDPNEMALDKRPYGGSIAEVWIYARLISDSGKRYILMRTVKGLQSAGVTLQLDGQPDSRVAREAVDIIRVVDPDGGLIFNGEGFDIQFGPNGVSWSDQNGAIAISGSDSPLGRVGTAEMIPFVHEDGATGVNIYTGQYQPVSGTVFGEPVSGMFVIDHFIGTEEFGKSFIVKAEVAWFKFANVFEDGSVEIGEFFILHPAEHGDSVVPAVQGGSVTDGMQVIASGDPFVSVTFGADGKTVVKEVWTLGDHQWEWTPDSQAPGTYGKMSQAYGVVRRMGDERKPVNQFAIAEYVVEALSESKYVEIEK